MYLCIVFHSMRKQTWAKKICQILWKEDQKKAQCERVLNFYQWKPFSEIYKPVRVFVCFVYKIPRGNCRLEDYLSYQAKIFLVNQTPV